MAHIWVIEIKICKEWEPCNDCCRLSRSEARELMVHNWKNTFPDEKFRVKKYVRVE